MNMLRTHRRESEQHPASLHADTPMLIPLISSPRAR
jgi:hypothetical protein